MNNIDHKKLKKKILFALTYVIIKWLVILVIGRALFKSGHCINWCLTAIPVIGITNLVIRQKIKTSKNKNKHVDN